MGTEVTEKYAGLSDEQLVALVAQGEKEALAALYDRYGRIVFSVALRLLRDPSEAEDVTQEVFLKVWARASGYQAERAPFARWLLSITHHHAVDEIRRRHRRVHTQPWEEALNQTVGSPDSLGDGQIWANLGLRSVREGLEQLPGPQKQAIVMAYFQGMTQVEIAQRCGAPLGTVKTRMRLGLQKLRKLLK